jgi:hypothetical protein
VEWECSWRHIAIRNSDRRKTRVDKEIFLWYINYMQALAKQDAHLSR